MNAGEDVENVPHAAETPSVPGAREPVFDSRAWISILRGGSLLSLARGSVLLLQAAQYFVLAKLLAPAGFGQVALFSIILLYGNLLGFGTDHVAVRETPGRLATNDRERFEMLKNLAFTSELMLRAFVGAVVVIVALVFYEGTVRIGMLLIAPILIFDKAQALYYGLGTATKNFKVLSRASMLSGLLMGCATLGLVKVAGVYTQLIAMLVTGVLTTLFYSRTLALKPRFCLNRATFWPVLKMGIPFVGMSLSYYLWKASDRTLIAGILSKEMLGQYTFAALSVQLIINFMNDFQSAFLPAVYERTAIANGVQDIYRIVRKPSIVLAYVTPVLIGAVAVCYRVAVGLIMPEYSGTVWVFRLLAGQLYFVNISMMAVYILRSPEVNKQSRLVWSYVAATAVSYALMLMSMRAGMGLAGVAAATLIAQMVAIAMTFAFAHKHYLSESDDAVSYYAELLMPLGSLALFFLGIYWIEEKLALTELWKTACGAGLLVVFAGAVFAVFERRVGLLAAIMRPRVQQLASS